MEKLREKERKKQEEKRDKSGNKAKGIKQYVKRMKGIKQDR